MGQMARTSTLAETGATDSLKDSFTFLGMKKNEKGQYVASSIRAKLGDESKLKGLSLDALYAELGDALDDEGNPAIATALQQLGDVIFSSSSNVRTFMRKFKPEFLGDGFLKLFTMMDTNGVIPHVSPEALRAMNQSMPGQSMHAVSSKLMEYMNN